MGTGTGTSKGRSAGSWVSACRPRPAHLGPRTRAPHRCGARARSPAHAHLPPLPLSCALQASLSDYAHALSDAEKTTSLRPDWPKGYSRLGAALFGLSRFDEAKDAYEAGLKIDGSNAQLREGAEEAERAAARRQRASSSGRSGGGGLGSLFKQPEVLARLAADPRTRTLLSQPDFAQMLKEIDEKPEALAQHSGDDRLQLALEVGLGLNVAQGPGASAGAEAPSSAADEPASGGRPTFTEVTDEKQKAAKLAQLHEEQQRAEALRRKREREEAEAKARAEAEEAEAKAREAEAQRVAALSPEEAAAEASEADRKREAEAQKAEGNAAYKRRDFAAAIEHYDRAIELYDKDVAFVTNKAAAYFEAGDYEACVKTCDEAVERGRALRADYKLIARALTRKGNALVKLDRLEEAIETFQKSLTEHRSADALAKLQAAEKALAKRKADAYVDLEKADEERELGNEAFRKQDYPAAVKHYTEAMKRGPAGAYPDHHKLLSNRAACYTKLGAWAEGLRDAEKCIELAPDFAKGYSRKGHLEFFAKEYDKARKTYEQGLEKDPSNAELREGLSRTLIAIDRLARGDASEAELKQQQAKAMQDPEVQAILTDPVMRQVLRDLEENPAAAQKHLKHPEIAKKIETLVASGIIRIQ